MADETTPEPTKNCPYCAETIKEKAVVCRFCGRNQPLLEEHHIAEANPDHLGPKETLYLIIGGVGLALFVSLAGIIKACT